MGRIWSAICFLLCAADVRAADVAGPGQKASGNPAELMAALENNDARVLAVSLRSVLLTFLPSPLYQDHSHWGQQQLVPDGAKWRGKGLSVHLERQYSLKNDGLWWRVWVLAPHLADTLVVDVRQLKQPDHERVLFTVVVGFEAETEYERQRWNEGMRVWSGSVRARMRVQLTLNCEATTRFENTGSFIPDTIFRLRVVSANLALEHVEVIHLPGLGGDAAKVLGEAVLGTIKQVHPLMERRLLEKANAAIVKAGDTKEVRISFKALLNNLSK
jgi:hypothetical protein